MIKGFLLALCTPILLAPLLIASVPSHATLMPGGSPTGLGGASNRITRSMAIVDKKFQQGKYIYKGKDKKLGRLTWCLKVEGQLVKLNIFNLHKTYRLFRGVATNYFVDSLYLCDRPENKAYDLIGKKNMKHVVYYLDRRFKLYLTERSSAYLYEKGGQ
jgi:hypothetical protein